MKFVVKLCLSSVMLDFFSMCFYVITMITLTGFFVILCFLCSLSYLFSFSCLF